MWDILIWALILGGVSMIFILFIIYMWCKRHKDFIKKAQSIQHGMTIEEVLNILGQPTCEETDEDKHILIWEKNQWKGIQNGGTVTRSIKVTFKNDKAISVSNKNFDKSTFW